MEALPPTLFSPNRIQNGSDQNINIAWEEDRDWTRQTFDSMYGECQFTIYYWRGNELPEPGEVKRRAIDQLGAGGVSLEV